MTIYDDNLNINIVKINRRDEKKQNKRKIINDFKSRILILRKLN